MDGGEEEEEGNAMLEEKWRERLSLVSPLVPPSFLLVRSFLSPGLPTCLCIYLPHHEQVVDWIASCPSNP